MGENSIDDWFMREILPLEPKLTAFLRRNWSNAAEIADLRQEAYARVYDAARKERPALAKPFLFQTARNLIIDRLRQRAVVSIQTMADFEWLNVCEDEPSPEARVAARQELRLLQAALESLPPRCRRVVTMRKVEGRSQKDVAKAMGITEDTVEHQVLKGMRLMAQAMVAYCDHEVPRKRRSAALKRFIRSE
jgi:RNA polymerase sigma-70 factor (ECF subfamily)